LDATIPYLQNEVSRAIDTKSDWKNASYALVNLSQIEAKKKNYSKALELALQARTFLSKMKFRDHKTTLHVFHQLANVYHLNKNYTLAFFYTDSSNHIQDTLQEQFGQLALLRIQQKIVCYRMG
jgi:hypothetical protein